MENSTRKLLPGAFFRFFLALHLSILNINAVRFSSFGCLSKQKIELYMIKCYIFRNHGDLMFQVIIALNRGISISKLLVMHLNRESAFLKITLSIPFLLVWNRYLNYDWHFFFTLLNSYSNLSCNHYGITE